MTVQTEVRECGYSKVIPQFKSCQKRKAVLLFAEIGRLKKGKVQVEFGQAEVSR